jgi:1-aminocyclopropane-1-carboxylate deaminase
MNSKEKLLNYLIELPDWPRARLAQLPTPIHRLERFGKLLDGPELWIKRDDLTGLPGGGNKTRKLEFLVGDAIAKGADMLVTVGAIQSNHTRQTAAAAAKHGLKCALLHFGWTKDAGSGYRKVGNILYSSLLGADLYLDDTERPIEDQGLLSDFLDRLKEKGHSPYLIPGGGSEHRLGSFGYMTCAAEIVKQTEKLGVNFDYVVHCTGSSSTQSGLIAGFAALNQKTRVIGVADDYETEIKSKRVLQLAVDALAEIRVSAEVSSLDVEIISADKSPYGITEPDTFAAMKLMAHTEGLIVDPVYEGKAIRGLLEMAKKNRFEKNCKILLMHLGGTPAVHAYANQFDPVVFLKTLI